MARRTAARRRRSSEKLLLPALRNPAKCSGRSNQRDADAAEREWDDRYRRFRRRRNHERKLEPLLPQLAYVYLSSGFPVSEHRYDETQRHGQDRRIKTFSGHHRRKDYGTSNSSEQDSSSCDSSAEDDRASLKPTTMRSQRMRSLAAMSKLQHDAATTIQHEYRFYLRRHTNRNHRNQRLARQAQDFMDVFLLQEVTSLVSVCLLEVLRETCTQEAVKMKRREDLANSLAGGVLASLIDECIRDAFHDVLQVMVKAYLAPQIDLSRASTPMSLAVAIDILDDWIKELLADLLPEVLVELAYEYTARQQHEVVWETLFQDELQALASGTMIVAKADLAKQRIPTLL